jgi:hypothetical protein
MQNYKEKSMKNIFIFRHYARFDSNNNMMHGFSDAFPNSLQDGDICINKQGGRHFEIFNQINPPLHTMDGIPLFKWDGKTIKRRTDKEIEADKLVLSELIQKQEANNPVNLNQIAIDFNERFVALETAIGLISNEISSVSVRNNVQELLISCTTHKLR